MQEIASKRLRYVMLFITTVAVAHFAISVFLWILVIIPGLRFGGVDWSYVLPHSAPAVLLLALFAMSLILVWRSRRLAVPLAVGSLLLAVGCFWYDTRHHYYQLQAMETNLVCKHYYATWFWYDDTWDPKR